MCPTIVQPDRLTDAQRTAVLRLAGNVEIRDGAPPLSDQALTQLGSTQVVHLLADSGPDLTGYAQLAGPTLEIAGGLESIAPLLDAALEIRSDLRVWSHGARSPLRVALADRGFAQARVLHQLRRSMREPVADVAVPDEVTIRTFAVGHDEQAWVRVNAAAFATHPEQGSWTVDDLLAREREPWFDAAGFLVAERDRSMIGYHWTKVHADGIGEVYVLGIDPAAQGLKLGAALLAAGLLHLAEHGCPEVLLYVDDDNTAAMRLYERAGFGHFDTDIQWSRR